MKKKNQNTQKRVNRIIKGLLFGYETLTPELISNESDIMSFKFGHKNPVIAVNIHKLVPGLRMEILGKPHDWDVSLEMITSHPEKGEVNRILNVGADDLILNDLDDYLIETIQIFRLEAELEGETLEYFRIIGEIKNV